MVEPNLKPDPMECPCGCGTVGQLRKKKMRDGQRHVSRCPCPRCAGSRHRKNASRRERQIARRSGGKRHVMSGALSGVDVTTASCDVEETADKKFTRGLFRWWEGAGVQGKVSRLLSRTVRPRAFVASKNGKPYLVVMPADDWFQLDQMAAAGSGHAVELVDQLDRVATELRSTLSG